MVGKSTCGQAAVAAFAIRCPRAAGVSIITLQFTLGQTLDVAEQEVQAAINAGGSLLPTDLPAPPVYAKINPADAPVLTLAITSDTMPLTQVQNIVTLLRLRDEEAKLLGYGNFAEVSLVSKLRRCAL